MTTMQITAARTCPYCNERALRPVDRTLGEPAGLVRRRCDHCGVNTVDLERPATAPEHRQAPSRGECPACHRGSMRDHHVENGRGELCVVTAICDRCGYMRPRLELRDACALAIGSENTSAAHEYTP